MRQQCSNYTLILSFFTAHICASLSDQEQRLSTNKTCSAERLRQNLDAAQLEIAMDTPPDGACMFHAVLHQMEQMGYPLHKNAHEFRQQMVNYMRQNPIIKVFIVTYFIKFM